MKKEISRRDFIRATTQAGLFIGLALLTYAGFSSYGVYYAKDDGRGVSDQTMSIKGFGVVVDGEKCTGCSKCQRACPTGIGPLENPREGECFYCLECLQCDHLKADFSPDYSAKSGASS